MANYTMELRKVCEYYTRAEVENWFKDYELTNYLTTTQIEQINKFHVWSKDRLATKIVDHYFMREIGFETPALFKHYAKVTMQEIMERYLPKIYSNFLEYDPLSNVDFTETYTREISNENSNEGSATTSGSQSNEGSSSSSSSQESNGFNILNDTPQTKITKQNLDSGIYASQTNQSETTTEIEDETTTENSTTTSSSTTSENSGSSSTIETFTRHEEGDNGVIITNQRLVKEFREIIVAIDEEIIYELGKLFMAIY